MRSATELFHVYWGGQASSWWPRITCMLHRGERRGNRNSTMSHHASSKISPQMSSTPARDSAVSGPGSGNRLLLTTYSTLPSLHCVPWPGVESSHDKPSMEEVKEEADGNASSVVGGGGLPSAQDFPLSISGE